jgi:hypothetical protein
VLADWLEEHGEAERAEVTRLQVALKDPRTSAKERDKLSKRLLALRTVHQGTWLGPALASFGVQYEAEFCGGWLWELGFDQHEGGFVNPFVEALSAAPEAGWLTRFSIELPDGGEPMNLYPLASSPHLGRLTELRISYWGEGCPTDYIDRALTTAAFPNLRRLALTGVNMMFDVLKQPKLKHCPRLQSLTIDFPNPDYGVAPANEVLQAFAKSAHFQDLREVTFKDRHGQQSALDGLLALVRSPRLPRLEAVDFSFEGEEEESPEYLAFVRALVAMPEAARLRKLSLWGYHIGDAGVEALAASPHLANLTNLNLSRNEISDEGALALAASPHLAHLSVLDLTHNQLTESGAEALLNSPHLKSLTRLGLGENKIATSAQKSLAKKRPSVEVRFER